MNRRIKPGGRLHTCMCAFGLCLLLTLTGCGRSSIPALTDPAGESIQGVTAQLRDVQNTLIVKGAVVGETKDYFYKEDKENLQYQVALGDKVTKGQPLVVADGEKLETQLKELRRELDGVKDQIAYLQEGEKFSQQKLTVEKQYAAADEQEQAAFNLEKDKVEQEYQIELAKLNASKLDTQIAELQKKLQENTICAQEEGYVSFLGFYDTVSAYAVVAIVTDTEQKKLVLKEDVDAISSGDYVRAYVEVDGKEKDLKEIPYTDTEKKMAEKNTRSLMPRFELDGIDGILGDTMAVHVVLQESKNAVAISRGCLYKSNDAYYVYKITGDTKEKCFVELGVQGNVDTEIVSGIDEGDLIYYPVDQTITFDKGEKLKGETAYLLDRQIGCGLKYPLERKVVTGVGESSVLEITDATHVSKGDLLASVKVSAGQSNIREAENSLDSLNRQYQSQKEMHEKTIAQLKREIAAISQPAASADRQSAVESGRNAAAASADTEEETTEAATQEASTAAVQTTEVTTEKATENNTTQENTPPPADTEKEETYPANVRLVLKNIELQQEELTMRYDEKNYNRQKEQLEEEVAQKKKTRGTVRITAQYTGDVTLYYDHSMEGRLIADNEVLGYIRDEAVSYLAANNVDNIFQYGNAVTYIDKDGGEHSGSVVGAYNAGNVEVYVEGSDGGSWSYSAEPDENQKTVYVLLDEGTENAAAEKESETEQSGLEEADVEEEEPDAMRGNLRVHSAAIKNAIVVDKEKVHKDEDGFCYVWVMKDGNPYKQYIEYVVLSDNRYWILDGLKSGDTILTEVK